MNIIDAIHKCPLLFIGKTTTNIVQDPCAETVEMNCMPVVHHKAQELDVVVFNGEAYAYHNKEWQSVRELFGLEG